MRISEPSPPSFELFSEAGVSILTEHRAGGADRHRLPAWKLVASLDGWTEVTTDTGVIRSPAVLVPPGLPNASRTTGPFVAVFVDSWSGSAGTAGVVDLGARCGRDVAEAARVALDGGGTTALEAVADEVIDRSRAPMASLVATITPTTTIDELANLRRVSVQHLRRLLRSELGASFTELIRWTRLKAAFGELAGASIAEAASGAGFADQPHFTRVARAMVGRTPGSLTRGAGR